MRTIRITGTGSALPGRIVTNKELEQMVETSDEWIRERTGIGERHVSVGETVVTLASEATRKALEQAGKRAEEIDLILVATCSPEQYLPCCACQVQAAVGAVNALAFDVNAACSCGIFSRTITCSPAFAASIAAAAPAPPRPTTTMSAS